jgi:flagellar M-ring protein FliF
MQHDAEYQAGRRVEQVVGQPGAVRQLQVLALVRQELDAARREQVRQLVAAAVGVSPERGDTVVVQGVASPVPATPQAAPAPRAAPAAATAPDPFAHWPFAVAALVIVAAALVGWWAHRIGRKAARAPVADPRQRELVLQRVRGWMLQAQAVPGAAASAASRQEAS